MIAADSSVVIAALAAWHPDHDRADAALEADVRIPAHCAIETYSVLTRLRPPHQVPADAALRALRARIRSPWLTLDARSQSRFLGRAQEAGITGGAIYGLMAREFAPVETRLKSVTNRLERLPKLYEQIRGTLAAKLAFFVKNA